MALQTLNTIKQWFKTGLKPTQAQFWDTWDSFRHKFEKIPVKDIDGIDELLLSKADKTVLDNHLADKSAHAPQVNTDWNSESGFSQLLNKPEFRTVNGQTIVGTGDIAITTESADLQSVLDNGSYAKLENKTVQIYNHGANPLDYSQSTSHPNFIQITNMKNNNSGRFEVSRGFANIVQSTAEGNTTTVEFENNFSETGNKVNIKFPSKPTGDYTLSTTSDFKTINGESIIGEGNLDIEPQGLKSVLDADPTASYGESKATLMGDYGTSKFNEIIISDETEKTGIYQLKNQLSFDHTVLDSNDIGNITLSEGNVILTRDKSNNQTVVDISDPVANTQLRFPAKSEEGKTYTIATTDDFKTINGESIVGSGDILINGGDGNIPTLQEVLDKDRNATNASINLLSEDGESQTTVHEGGLNISEKTESGFLITDINKLGVSVSKDEETTFANISADELSLNKKLSGNPVKQGIVLNQESSGASTIKLPLTSDGNVKTLATTEDFKTINGETIVGEGDITIEGGTTPDATTAEKGIVKLAGDLGGTADLPTTPTAIHITGNESFTGVKSSLRNEDSLESGIALINDFENGEVLRIENKKTGVGQIVVNSGTGKGIEVSNSLEGDAIVVNGAQTATGFNFVGQNDGSNTFTVDKLGNGIFSGNLSGATPTAANHLITKGYADNLVVGMLNLRGSYDASSNLYPSNGGSGTAGAIRKGDLWYVSFAGTLSGKAVNVGDSFVALSDTPGQTYANWNVMESNIGYVPANDANVVHKIGDETIDGQKTWNDGGIFKNQVSASSYITFSSNVEPTIIATSLGKYNSRLLIAGSGDSRTRFTLTSNGILETVFDYTMPANSGTLALNQDVLHNTGDENFTGVKRSTNTGVQPNGQNGGFDLINDSDNYQVLKVTNQKSGSGLYILNSDIGRGIDLINQTSGDGMRLSNLGSGFGISGNNGGTGSGILFQNTRTGKAINILNSATGQGIDIDNSGGGRGIRISNSQGFGIEVVTYGNNAGIFSQNLNEGTAVLLENRSSGNGVYITDSGTGNAINIQKTTTATSNGINIDQTLGQGINIKNNGNGNGIYTVNSSAGFGSWTLNSGSGRGNYIDNSGTGQGLWIENRLTGRGIDISNQKEGRGLNIANQGIGSGAFIQNQSTGTGLDMSNIGIGKSISILNSSTGQGININNAGSGGGIRLYNALAGQGLDISNILNGIGLNLNNESTGIGVNLFNISTGKGMYLNNTNTGDAIEIRNGFSGNGINISNISTGKGIVLINDNAGTGIEISNRSTGNAQYINNGTTGVGFKVDNRSGGRAILVNSDGTGLSYVGQNNGVNTFTVDKFGNGFFNGNVGIGTAAVPIRLTIADDGNTFSSFTYGNGQTNGIAVGTDSGNVPVIQGHNKSFSAITNISLNPSGGNILIGKVTDNGAKFQVNGVGYFKNGIQVGAISNSPGNSSSWIQAENDATSIFLTNASITKYAGLLSNGDFVTSGNASFTGTISTAGIINPQQFKTDIEAFNDTPLSSNRTISTEGVAIPGAGAGFGFLETFRYENAEFGMQRMTYFTGTSAGKVYVRIRNTGDWTAWVEK